jgi:hypothetical protein
MHKTGFGGGLFFKKRKKEFAWIQSNRQEWIDYEKNIVQPVTESLYCIRNQSSAYIVYDATFRNLKKALTSRKFDVVFILAHHIKNNKKDEPPIKDHPPDTNSQIEFADGGYAHEEIYDLLDSLDRDQNVSLLFFVCESEDLQELFYGKLDTVKSVASAYWKMPMVEGIQFIKTWIFFMDGGNTLSQAYDFAIEEHINQLFAY